jgi:hypothetical protein
MTSSASISANPPENPGLRYAGLRSEGIRLVQQLSGSIWTDYNEHDPGVTTLEQLCYALTELSYRAELPVADILTDPRSGAIHPGRHGLYTARQIFPCNPVTLNDYRKVIADRVPEVANIWVTPHSPTKSIPVNGLYDFHIYAMPKARPKPPDPDGCGPDSDDSKKLVRRVRRVYSRCRNLCEDIHSIRVLKPLSATVHADVTIDGSTRPEKAMAEILFALGKLLAPELTRQPLNALLNAGQSPDEVFNGPLLRRGFVDNAQMQPQMTSLPVNQVVAAIAETSGVTGVSGVSVHTGDSGVFGPNSSVPVQAEQVLDLDTGPDSKTGRYPLRLLRNGAVCNPDSCTVRFELALLWADYRRTWPLEAQYEEYFAIPRGQTRDLEQYYSVQNQFPSVYGIGNHGLSVDATPERLAQAKQFKGYLLPFDQLMADYFAQLSHASDLYSARPEEWQTYYCQSLEKTVPGVEPLLEPTYAEGLRAITAMYDNSFLRRARFTEFLLSLYACELNSIADNAQCQQQKQQTQKLARARLELLRLLLPATGLRGKAFDYRARPSFPNIADMEIRCRIEMGLDLQSPSLTATLGDSNLRVVRGGRQSSTSSRSADSTYFEENFRPVSSYPEPSHVPDSSSVLKGASLTEDFIGKASNADNLFVGQLPDDKSAAIAHRSAAGGGWTLIDVFDDLESAIGEAYAVCRQLKSVHKARTQLYIVEHTLLRFGRRRKGGDTGFPYGFTLTAVVGLPSEERKSREDRKVVEQIVRENTPAHILPLFCFLDPCALLKFEHHYDRWREALRKRSGIPAASARLRQFLEHRAITASPPAPLRGA